MIICSSSQVSFFLSISACSFLFFLFSLLISSMAHIYSSRYSTSTSSISSSTSSYASSASSYFSSESSLLESFTAMNRTLPVSLLLTSSSIDDELSSLVHKIFLKIFFVFLLPLYVCLPYE
jgi:hypothetical protein